MPFSASRLLAERSASVHCKCSAGSPSLDGGATETRPQHGTARPHHETSANRRASPSG
jgi:hypothetical protein